MPDSSFSPADVPELAFPRVGAMPASTAMLPDHVDTLIVGSGAGGSAAAYKLALAGKRVLVLEKGTVLPDDGSPMDPAKVAAGTFNSKETWRDVQGGKTIVPQEHFNLGGKTCWYGAALLRMTPEEFGPEPGFDLLPWPVPHDEYSGYYDEAERLLEVHRFPDGSDLDKMMPAFDANGWHKEVLGLGVDSDIASTPYVETHYDGYGVPGHYKANGPNRLLDKVAGHENLTILTGADVERLLPDPANPRRIAGVKLVDGREVLAATTWLAAGAMHSPRLLQPYFASTGLDQVLPGADLVGRYFKKHILTAVVGFGVSPKTDRLCKTTVLASAKFPHGGVQPLGGWVDRETVRSLIGAFAPDRVVDFFAKRSYGFFLQTEDGSHPDNRVTVGSDGGPPMLDYTTDRMPKLAAEHRDMVLSFMAALVRAGYAPFKQATPINGTAHCVGTLVAGSDPARSVTDPVGRVHGMENLYVVDGSILPRLSSKNPALTIFAWALRAVDRFVESGHAVPQAAPAEGAGQA